MSKVFLRTKRFNWALELSIIDLKNGTQPFFSKDRRYAVLMERFTIIKSRSDFKNKGIKFLTSLYGSSFRKPNLWGEFFQKLNGMFAFALYDLKMKINDGKR